VFFIGNIVDIFDHIEYFITSHGIIDITITWAVQPGNCNCSLRHQFCQVRRFILLIVKKENSKGENKFLLQKKNKKKKTIKNHPISGDSEELIFQLDAYAVW
jgi:hypothetical protein